MTIYQIIEDADNNEILTVSKLGTGKHTLDRNGLLLPITVHADDSVTIHFDEATGRLENLSVDGFSGEQEWKDATGLVLEVKINPNQESLDFLSISGHEDILNLGRSAREISVAKKTTHGTERE